MQKTNNPHLMDVLNDILSQLGIDLLGTHLMRTLLCAICLPYLTHENSTTIGLVSLKSITHLVQSSECQVVHLNPDRTFPVILALTEKGM